MKKVLLNISGYEIPNSLNDNSQLVQTYTEILKTFDEIHFVCRSINTQSGTIRHPSVPIFVHHVKVPNSIFGKTFIAVIKLYFNSIKISKQFNINYFIASDPTIGGLTCVILKIINKKNFILEIQAEMTRISPLVVGKFKAFGFKWITLIVCRCAMLVRAVSRTVKEQLVADGVNETKIRVVTSRVRLDSFNSNLYTNSSVELRNKYGILADEKLFVFIGRLVVFKGLKYLFEALKNYNAVPFKLLIVGEGPLRESLLVQCIENNILEKVIFHGAVEYNEVPYFMAAADLIIIPSTDEGFPRVMLEAMAMKKLVAASLVGGVADIARNEENGYYFESKNPNAILTTLNNIFSKNNEGLIENAYQEVITNYPFEVVMKKYNQLFNEYIEMIK